ncbi:MAG: PAS domain S-box protein [Stigonema ocellatum SAG 48.90 = DSM 106950]|nr:PAS domain S-box protein [Stigonema ocellatum SAG 48.90 = DSM 106950]
MDHPQFTGDKLHNPHNQQPEENFSVGFLLQIINGIADPVFVKDRRHCWVLLNDTFCDFIRHSREELLGKSDYDFFPQQEADVFWDTDELVFTTGMTNENEEHFTDACGVKHVISTKKSLFVDGTGNKFLVGTIRDITKNVTKYQRVEAELGHSQQLLQFAYAKMETLVLVRTQQLEQINEALQAKIAQHEETEAALRESEKKHLKLAQNLPGMLYVFVLQPDGSMFFTYVSDGSYEIYGLPPEEIELDADLIISIVHPNDLQEFKESIAVATQTLQPWRWEGRIVLSCGQVKWIKGASRPEVQANGNILWYGVLLEITERKLAEEALKESEKKYRNLVETSQDMIWSVDTQARYTFVNQAVRHIYGYQPEEMIGRLFTDFQPPEEVEKDLEVYHRLLAGESVLEYETIHITKDGRRVNLLFNAIALRDTEGNVLGTTGTASNITERKGVEETLIRSNAFLKAQQEAALDGILVVDENRMIVSSNQRFAQFWQIPEAVIQTRDQRQVMALVLDQVENAQDFLAKVEYLYQHPEETSRDEIAFRDGRILDRYSAPVHSLAGDYYGRISCFRDITEKKRSEEVLRKSEARLRLQAKELQQALLQLQRTQIQLVQSEKMSSLGQLVAGIAHEINNPVNFIYGNISYTNQYAEDLLKLLELYQQHYPHPVLEIQDYLEVIELDFLKSDLSQILKSMKVGAERIQRIVLSLRTFSRLDEAEMKTVDIHEGIDSTLMILQSRLNANNCRPAIEVIKEYSNLPPVECYPGQLNQVFINILTNAIDALEEGVGIAWGFNPKGSGESLTPSIWIRTEVVEPNRVIVRIADNGPGVPEKVKQRIFDPFFTTKPVGKGTGLGLSISYQIVTDRHCGSLQCISEPGQGAEFVVDIPLAQESQTPSS